MKAIISAFITLVIWGQALAAHGPLESSDPGLLISEMTYELEMASDEFEQSAIAAKSAKKILDLMKTMSNEEQDQFRESLLNQVNPEFAKDFRAVTKLVDFNNLSEFKKLELMRPLLAKHGQRGASWNGQSVANIVLMTIAVVVIGVFAWRIGCFVYWVATAETPSCAYN